MPSATELIGPGGLGLLRASDLPANVKQFTVTFVSVEHNEQLKSPLVATVEEEILPGVAAIGLNKTNIRSLVEYLGDDYSKWAGATVTFAKIPQNNPTTGTTGWGIRVVEASFPPSKRK